MKNKLEKLKQKRIVLLSFSILFLVGSIIGIVISVLEIHTISSNNRVHTNAIIYNVEHYRDLTDRTHEKTRDYLKYEVDGKEYISKLQNGFFIFDEFRVGKKVSIYYDKNNPEQCGTYEGIYLFIFIIFVIFLLNIYINNKIKK